MDTSSSTGLRRPSPVHEHGWTVVSAHPTSTGSVLYVRCGCGARRVDLGDAGGMPPRAVSRVVGGPGQNSPSGRVVDGPRSPLR